MHLLVGSTNPVKVNAVTIAASETWPEAVIQGFEVQSGIAEQPMSDDQTRIGAQNRAKAALAKAQTERLALGVGLEGGVFQLKDELWSTVWVAVVDLKGNVAESNGARFKLPDIIAQPILAGREMGLVVGELFGDDTIKTKNGAIGVVTKNFIDRTEEYSGIAKMALGLWFGRDWHLELQKQSR